MRAIQGPTKISHFPGAEMPELEPEVVGRTNARLASHVHAKVDRKVAGSSPAQDVSPSFSKPALNIGISTFDVPTSRLRGKKIKYAI